MKNLSEWLNLFVRWFHVVAGIGWIGSSFFFMWLDGALEKHEGSGLQDAAPGALAPSVIAPTGIATPPPSSVDSKILGSLWMVHSGGFYRVEKRALAPGELPRVLHWFKWEALLTWVSGMFLLGIVYYWGGLMDEVNGSSITLPGTSAGALLVTSPLGFATIGIAIIVLSWIAYDNLWRSPIASNILVASLLSVALIGAIILIGTHFLGSRASFIHVGAAMGTFMVANVWLRILPAQRQLIRMAGTGQARDPVVAERAKMRSRHNNYMTLPVVFIMISNHFPITYGSNRNWLVLMGLMAASVCVRIYINLRESTGSNSSSRPSGPNEPLAISLRSTKFAAVARGLSPWWLLVLAVGIVAIVVYLA